MDSLFEFFANIPETPAVNAFAYDLTELAKEGKLNPVVGREKEITQVIQVLCS